MREARFGELFTSISNGLAVRQSGGASGDPITRIETISSGEVSATRVGYADVGAMDYPEGVLVPGDLLFSHINSPDRVGNCALYRGDPDRLIHGMNLLRLQCDRDVVMPEFALRMIRSPRFRRSLKRFVNRAVNQASVSIANLRSITVQLPPLAQQERIVTVLSAAEGARRNSAAVILRLDELTRASFVSQFGGVLQSRDRWARARLGDLGDVITGNTPSRERPPTGHDAIPWAKADNLSSPRTTVSEPAEAVSRSAEKPPRVVGPGAILVTCIAGSPGSIGNAAIADRELAFNQQINAIVPHEAETEFLFAQLLVGKQLVQEQSTGGMKGIVNKSRFASIEVANPPRELQRSFGKRFRQIEAVKATAQARFTHLDALLASFQHRAFAGQL